MTIWDDRILEYRLENEGGTVGEITKSESIRVSNAHVSNRCSTLAEHGLVRAIGNGAYVITDKGRASLDGEYDAENEVYLDRSGVSDDVTQGESTGP